jgi:hypothetical protein
VCALLLFAGCSHKNKATTIDPAPVITATPIVGAEAGLEVLSWSSGVDEATFAKALLPYAESLAPVSSEMEAFYRAHGLRLLSIPKSEVDAIVATLGMGATQRQWLGQAVVWTEASRGPALGASQVVALDAERIRLGGGALRLLTRSWLEPIPAERAGAEPRAVLRMDLVLQHLDDEARAQREDPLNVRTPVGGPEDQGLLFSRLFARMSLAGDRAIIIVSERPGVDWANPPIDETSANTPSEARPAPKVGEVVRSGSRAKDSTPSPETRKKHVVESDTEGWRPKPVAQESQSAPVAPAEPRTATPPTTPDGLFPVGPRAPRVPTLGEAMLGRSGSRRMIVIFLPRVPEKFELLGTGP